MTGCKTEVAAGYEAIADWFDENRDKTLSERKYLSDILARMPKTGAGGGALLDLGCGTGEPIARFFIENNINVTGIDIAPRMIEICRNRFPTHIWQVGDMRGLDLGKKFDAIVAWDSFFHLTQDAQKDIFAVFARHAHKGALLAFTSGTESGTRYGTMQGRGFHHASLATGDYNALLTLHEFQILRHACNDKACGGRTVWVAQYMPYPDI